MNRNIHSLSLVGDICNVLFPILFSTFPFSSLLLTEKKHKMAMLDVNTTPLQTVTLLFYILPIACLSCRLSQTQAHAHKSLHLHNCSWCLFSSSSAIFPSQLCAAPCRSNVMVGCFCFQQQPPQCACFKQHPAHCRSSMPTPTRTRAPLKEVCTH